MPASAGGSPRTLGVTHKPVSLRFTETHAVYAIKTEVKKPEAESWAFEAQKTMYSGKYVSVGDRIYVFASENEGGAGLVAVGVVTSASATPRVSNVERQTPRVSIRVQRTGTPIQRLGRAELKPFDNWEDGRPETELNFKLYRQATNKIIGLSETATLFIQRHFTNT